MPPKKSVTKKGKGKKSTVAQLCEKARLALIRAQEKARIAYEKVVQAREKYAKQLEKKSKSVKSKSGKKSTKGKKGKKSMRGGGGSDWLNTVNSRGNVAAPDNYRGVDGATWYSQFEKSGKYIPNSVLRKGSLQLQSSQPVSVPNGLYADASKYQSISSVTGDLLTQRT